MPGRVALFSLVIATVASSSVFSTTASIATASEVELCFGQSPTIVGAPDVESLQGTEGPDVVVSNGAYGVDLLGGDDLLCITGVPDGNYDEYPAPFFTGSGSDRIDSSKATTTFFVLWPGPGSDEVIGGLPRDVVVADDRGAAEPDADVINTAGGNDEVISGGGDVVNLGWGSNELWLRMPASGGVFEGGGADTLVIQVAHLGEHSWKVDNRAGRITRDGDQVAGFTGFSHFEARARGTFQFIGSDDRETFGMFTNQPWQPRRGSLEVRMRGGDDEVYFLGRAPGGRFDGGAGIDTFYYTRSYDEGVNSRLPIVFNLTSGRLEDVGSNEAKRRAVNFENADVFNTYCTNHGQCGTSPMTLKGTAGPNSLHIWGFPSDSHMGTIYGRGGNDLLMGGNGYDILIGGEGQDVARGHRGIDRCDAEIRYHCEL